MRSWSITSQATTSAAATPSSAARNARSRRPRGAEPPDRREVLLAVEDDALLVDVAVEVDGQLRHPQERPVDLHQAALEPSRERDPARQPEVAVEPGVHERAAVDVDAELAPAAARRCRAAA